MAHPVAPASPPARVRVSGAERRQALATCLWLAAAVLLGGLDLPARGYEAFRYAPFGIVSGLLGILYVFAMSLRQVIRPSGGWLRPLLLAYWVAATATMFRVLLPPPGLVQAGLALLAAIGAGVVVSQRDREGAALWLGILAVGLAVLEFALVPAFQARSGLPNWGPLQLGEAANAFRDFFVSYAPQRPAVQGLHFGALVCYALAVRAQWPATGSAHPTA